MRSHDCPTCGKHWPCLAESGLPRAGEPTRPIVPCVYPDRLLCPPCATQWGHDAPR